MPSYALRKAACRVLPDRWFARLLYLKHHGRLPRTPPVSFTERVGARLGAAEMERYQDYCDKRAVRDLVTPKIGPDYMIPLHATADRLTQDVWDRLPNAFMIKPNHGSGWFRMVRNKSAEDFDALVALTDSWLGQNFYYIRRETQYRHIKPCLLFEKALFWDGGDRLADYKIHCFHGKIAYIQVVLREPNKARLLFDANWNRLRIRNKYPNDGAFPRPPRLKEMCTIAETLSVDFDYVRVDLFNVPDGVFFAELTFTPDVGADGFDPVAFDDYLGALWDGTVEASLSEMAAWRLT